MNRAREAKDLAERLLEKIEEEKNRVLADLDMKRELAKDDLRDNDYAEGEEIWLRRTEEMAGELIDRLTKEYDKKIAEIRTVIDEANDHLTRFPDGDDVPLED